MTLCCKLVSSRARGPTDDDLAVVRHERGHERGDGGGPRARRASGPGRGVAGDVLTKRGFVYRAPRARHDGGFGRGAARLVRGRGAARRRFGGAGRDSRAVVGRGAVSRGRGLGRVPRQVALRPGPARGDPKDVGYDNRAPVVRRGPGLPFRRTSANRWSGAQTT